MGTEATPAAARGAGRGGEVAGLRVEELVGLAGAGGHAAAGARPPLWRDDGRAAVEGDRQAHGVRGRGDGAHDARRVRPLHRRRAREVGQGGSRRRHPGGVATLFAPPEIVRTAIFAELPAKLRKSGTPAERLAAGKSPTPPGCFLEGPAFDREGNLYVVDLAFGRIFCISKDKQFKVAAEYDGKPNGFAIHRDGR